jgi:hypothetical protein
MLNNKAIKLLAKSLAPEVAAGIFESEQWVTFCHEVIPDLITEIAGEMEEDLLFELSLIVMDSLKVSVYTER